MSTVAVVMPISAPSGSRAIAALVSLGMSSSGLLSGAAAFAQPLPDAGALQPQREDRSRIPPAAQIPLTTPAEPAAPASTGSESRVTLTVTEFRFEGASLLGEERLAAVVGPWRDRPVGFADLQQAAAAVAAAYRDSGRVARVFLPRQDVTDGVVTFEVVEGVLGQVRRDDDGADRLSASGVEAYVAAVQAPGEPIDTTALDRAMLLLDELPGVAASGRLAAGEGRSETDLIVAVRDEPLLSARVAIDNTGSRSTGAERLVATGFLDSPLSIGDQASATVVHTEGSDYFGLEYSLPVGARGFRLEAGGSSFDYRLVADDFEALDGKGGADAWSLRARYPLVRGRARNLSVSGGIRESDFDNRAGGVVATRYDIRAVSVDLAGNLYDGFGGGGASVAGVTLTAGAVDLDGSPNQALDAATTRVDGDYAKLRYFASRLQTVSPRLSYYVAVSGQLAGQNLDSSEKFYLGGAGGVRAYPFLEGGGSEGLLVSNELRGRVTDGLTLSAFYDWGQVAQNQDNAFPGAPALNRFDLDGAGLSLAWVAPNGVRLDATLARRLDDNPNATVLGTDQDGSLTRNRVWFGLAVPF